jgi:hypothetical protein
MVGGLAARSIRGQLEAGGLVGVVVARLGRSFVFAARVMACGLGLIRSFFLLPADNRLLSRKRMQWVEEQKRSCLAGK